VYRLFPLQIFSNADRQRFASPAYEDPFTLTPREQPGHLRRIPHPPRGKRPSSVPILPHLQLDLITSTVSSAVQCLFFRPLFLVFGVLIKGENFAFGSAPAAVIVFPSRVLLSSFLFTKPTLVPKMTSVAHLLLRLALGDLTAVTPDYFYSTRQLRQSLAHHENIVQTT